MEGEAFHFEPGVLSSSIACVSQSKERTCSSTVHKCSRCACEAKNNSTIEESTIGEHGGI
jgi:hypothetical protein